MLHRNYGIIFFISLCLLTISGCSLFSGKSHREIDSQKLVELSSAKEYIGNLRWPVPGKKVSSFFGWRSRIFHEGLDIPAKEGTPVLAAHDGQVVYRNSLLRGYGNLVVIKAPGLMTVYGHNSEFNVHLGDRVKAGDVIAYVGATGEATGPHLHFETRIKDSKGKNIAVNPLVFYK